MKIVVDSKSDALSLVGALHDWVSRQALTDLRHLVDPALVSARLSELQALIYGMDERGVRS